MLWIGTKIVRNRHCLDALQSEIGKHGACHISACIVCTWREGEGIERVVILRYSRLRQGTPSVTSRAKCPLNNTNFTPSLLFCNENIGVIEALNSPLKSCVLSKWRTILGASSPTWNSSVDGVCSITGYELWWQCTRLGFNKTL
jgi:hypothetical protein